MSACKGGIPRLNTALACRTKNIEALGTAGAGLKSEPTKTHHCGLSVMMSCETDIRRLLILINLHQMRYR